jgi:DNA polymerase-4
MASVQAKPIASPAGIEPGAGVVEVRPGEELAFLHPLPVRRLWGVGPKTHEKLDRLGVRTIGDLAELPEGTVVAALGRSSGQHLLALSKGLDARPVEVERDPKSIGHEETSPHDLHDLADLDRELVRLSDAVASRLRRFGSGARTITLKVRFAGFRTVTRAITLPFGVDTGPEIVAAVKPLLHALDVSPGVRLVGVSASHFADRSEQLDLFSGTDEARSHGASSEDQQRSAAAIDEIRERFGAAAIGPASSISGRRLRVVRRGAQQWGPDQAPTEPAADERRGPNGPN